MIQGIFGNIEAGHVIGWAYDTDKLQPPVIVVKQGDKVLGKSRAQIVRKDLLPQAAHLGGKCGYRIPLPKGKKEWEAISVYANGELLPKSPALKAKIEKAEITLSLPDQEAVFFIHVPKTAGTAFKKLLEKQFAQSRTFPNQDIITNNSGLYPHFDQIIKYPPPSHAVELFIGHYPYAAHHVFATNPKKIVIFRDPVERVISNIFHMKNHDIHMRDLTPEEIYNRGSWNYVNLQVRYMVDSGIHPNMHFLASKPLGKRALELAIANMKACTVVGLSEELEATVHLANKQFGWKLSTPKRINVAKSEKSITDELRKRIEKDNALDIAFYAAAKSHFYEQLRQK